MQFTKVELPFQTELQSIQNFRYMFVKSLSVSEVSNLLVISSSNGSRQVMKVYE